MIAFLRSLHLPWPAAAKRRWAVVVTAAKVLDRAGRRALAAMRQWWPLTSTVDALDAHAAPFDLTRQPGESDDDWRLRVALAPAEARQWGQRRWLESALPAGWLVHWELPRDGLRLGVTPLPARLGSVPYVRLRAPIGTDEAAAAAVIEPLQRRLAPDIAVTWQALPAEQPLLAAPGEPLLVAPGVPLLAGGD